MFKCDIVQLTSFHVNLEVYFGLERFVETTGGGGGGGGGGGSSECGRVLHITAEHDCRRLHCALRDLSSLLQGLGRLSHHFVAHDKFTASFDDASVLVDRYLSACGVFLYVSVCL